MTISARYYNVEDQYRHLHLRENLMSHHHHHHHFSCSSLMERRAPCGVSVIIHILRHTVGLLWTSDQPVAKVSTYTGQHNI
jgi:hypothetical protein